MNKIVVLTPVKNESWILERFLSVTSTFADCIIIADQNSSDTSRSICSKYNKVHLIKNESDKYNEADRQVLLIETARKLFPNDKRILLALDADEILAANAMENEEWNKMISSEPGTILYFEKPTFCNGTSNVIRYYDEGWPLGYIDDGVKHFPSEIHSTRVPNPPGAKKLVLSKIKILHYGLARKNALYSKLRYYSCLECIMGTKTLFKRRISYPKELDFKNAGSNIEEVKQEWILKWELQGIDMLTVVDEKYYWYDKEVLIFLNKYGSKIFFYDDIWYANWNEAARYFNIKLSTGATICPPFLLLICLNILTETYSKLLKFRRRFSVLVK